MAWDGSGGSFSPVLMTPCRLLLGATVDGRFLPPGLALAQAP